MVIHNEYFVRHGFFQSHECDAPASIGQCLQAAFRLGPSSRIDILTIVQCAHRPGVRPFHDERVRFFLIACGPFLQGTDTVRHAAFLIMALACAALSPPEVQAGTSASSLCDAGEQVVFSCELKAGKKVALCAQAGIPLPGAQLQYRFGTSDKLEFRYPEVAAYGISPFFYSSTGYSGGGELHIRFATGEHDYLLFERTVQAEVRGKKQARFSSGVIVRKNKKVISVRPCLTGGGLQMGVDALLPEEAFEYIDELP